MTEILDIPENSDTFYFDSFKVALADKIINIITPLVDEVVIAQKNRRSKISEDLEINKQTIAKLEKEIKIKVSSFERKKIMFHQLTRIRNVMNSGFIFSKENLRSVSVIVNSLESLKPEKVDEFLSELFA